MFATSPVGSIWLEMSINWHTTSQGPKKKSIQITKRRIDPCPAHTARNKGSFTTMVLWTVNPFCPQLYVYLLLVHANSLLRASNFHRWFVGELVSPTICWSRVLYKAYQFTIFEVCTIIVLVHMYLLENCARLKNISHFIQTNWSLKY